MPSSQVFPPNHCTDAVLLSATNGECWASSTGYGTTPKEEGKKLVDHFHFRDGIDSRYKSPFYTGVHIEVLSLYSSQPFPRLSVSVLYRTDSPTYIRTG